MDANILINYRPRFLEWGLGQVPTRSLLHSLSPFWKIEKLLIGLYYFNKKK